MPKQIIIPQDQLQEKFLTACQIIEMLRHYKVKWETNYGAPNRNNLRRWEEKADAFLSSLSTEEVNDNDND
ncbi:MAG: hypothetical protein IPH18_18260 [Chitinophagaceae bacterium]|nr:hypothetical protein [Chitinophagaceae bacterium]